MATLTLQDLRRPFGVSDGEAAVRDLLNGMIIGFPDWHIETGPFRHGDDFVFVEVRMTGTHNGPWAGWEPTGRKCARRSISTWLP